MQCDSHRHFIVQKGYNNCIEDCFAFDQKSICDGQSNNATVKLIEQAYKCVDQ